jgi:hypothetical protein
LFAEAALARGARLELYIPFEEPTFLEKSVDFADSEWPARFFAAKARGVLHVAPRELGPPQEGEDPYVRNNRWMLGDALRFGADKVNFVSLWNGEGGDGPGGTRHMMEEVRNRGGAHDLARNEEVVGLIAGRCGEAGAGEGGKMPKPICFMIMPYGKKATQAEPSVGVAEIDFNALWDRAYAPVIETLGYDPVRADQDTGSMIITQMIERLYFADLVLADMTIPNGNVYYEVGIRHAAKEIGCVLLAAEWSKALFDVTQMRTLRYPLPEGSITETTAEKIRTAIKGPIDSLGRGVSPIFESIPGYPSAVNPATASSMKDVMAKLAAFQGEIRAVRALPRSDRMAKAKELVNKYWKPPVTGAIVIALLRLLKDSADGTVDWSWIADFISRFPAAIADEEEVRETSAFATSNAGKPIEAIAKLEELIARSGPTPSILPRRGRVARATTSVPDQSRHCARVAVAA